MNTDNSIPDAVPQKEKFNFWRFIRLCSLKDFNEFKDEQSQEFLSLNRRISSLEDKLNYKSGEIQASLNYLSGKFCSCLEESVQIIGKQISEMNSALINRQEEFESKTNLQLTNLAASLEKLIKDLSTVSKKIKDLQNSTLSLLDESKSVLLLDIQKIQEDQKPFLKEANNLIKSNKNTEEKVKSACESVNGFQEQLKKQSKIHKEIEMMCAELMQTVRLLALNSLSGQIEMLLPEDSLKNASSEALPSNTKKKR